MKIAIICSSFRGQLHLLLDSFYEVADDEAVLYVYDPPGAHDLIKSTSKIVREVNKLKSAEQIFYTQDKRTLNDVDFLIFLGLEMKALSAVQQATISDKLFRNIFENNLNEQQLKGIYFGGEMKGLINAAVLGKRWPELRNKVTVFSGIEYKGRKIHGGSANDAVVVSSGDMITEMKEEVKDVTDEYEDQEFPYFEAKMWCEVLQCILNSEHDRIPNTYRGIFKAAGDNEDENEDLAIPIFTYRFRNPVIHAELDRQGQETKVKIKGILDQAFPEIEQEDE